MAKLTTYIIIMVGLVTLFYFTGLLTDCKNPTTNEACEGDDECLCKGRTPNSMILDLALKPENIKFSTILQNGLLLLTGITALGLSIIAGLALRDARLALLGPFALFSFNILYDFISVIVRINSIHPILSVVISLVLSPLLIYYVFAAIEWWGGTG